MRLAELSTARDAIARTVAEGFPNGTVIFLDLERMDTVPESMRSYYKAWTATVLADGRFRPGYYTHNHNAELVYRDVSQVFVKRCDNYSTSVLGFRIERIFRGRRAARSRTLIRECLAGSTRHRSKRTTV
jgi:hypothetical protein